MDRQQNDPASDPVPAKPPGVALGVCSIAAGVVGFSVPILGMLASCVGIWLGVWAIRQGRARSYKPDLICCVIGLSISGLGIAYWIGAILMESYH